MRSLPIRILLFAAIGVAIALPVHAGEGVIEINQTCAVQTGCFDGDGPGLPVEIAAAGSYRLTSNLVVPDQNTTAIRISTHEVAIDLNDFMIRGPVNCFGTPLACTPAGGTGSGVTVPTSGFSGISVRNGIIRGMGNSGVFLGFDSEVTGVTVRSNGRVGIFVSGSSIVSDNISHGNGTNGIEAQNGSIVSKNAVYGNGSNGIFASFGATVSGNTAFDNGGDGIETITGSAVFGNTVRLNTGFGLNLGAQSGYRENVITGNAAGTVNGASAVNLGDNACNGTTTCP